MKKLSCLSESICLKVTTAFLFLLLASSFVATAKTVYSISSSADWNTSSDWSSTSGGAACHCTPNESKDNIYIETNTVSSSGLTFKNNSELIVRNNSTLTINGNSSFNSGSSITVESGSTLVVNGDLVNQDHSIDVTIDGSLIVNGNFLAFTESVLKGSGTLTTTGSATTTGTATVFGSTNDCPKGPCIASTTTPLPVEFLYFNLITNENEVQVAWSTASEFNSDYFVVQRSQDGSEFVDVVKTTASGNSSTIKNYFTSDKEPMNGISYYRIKQVDFNGQYKFSNILAVSFQNGEALSVYPNPGLKDQPFKISFLGKKGNTLHLVVRDLQGTIVYSNIILVSNNKEEILIDLSGKIAAGIYFVVATSGDSIYKSKMVLR